jgi:2-polyprenyl-6-methoxyphenol hydroxylase-like FAD-dependent oxidoreductase
VDTLRRVYADAGYLSPRVLAALAEDSTSMYLDRLAQVRLPSWSSGRIAVVGDAAYCPTPISGMGTTLALTGAYLLAEELVHGTDHDAAFTSYEKLMRPIVDAGQKLPPGVPGIANPTSRLGVAIFRSAVRLAGSGPARSLMSRFMSSSEDTVALPTYDDSLGRTSENSSERP